MKTINLNLALIAIEVLSLNKDNDNMATINFGYAEARADGIAKKWSKMILEDIFITGRAIKQLMDPDVSLLELNKEYCSINISKEKELNPLCLMRKHRVDDEGNSEIYYYLKCVEENGSYLKESTMPDGRKAVRRIWRPNKPAYKFVRYVNMYDKQKAYYDEQVSKLETAKA